MKLRRAALGLGVLSGVALAAGGCSSDDKASPQFGNTPPGPKFQCSADGGNPSQKVTLGPEETWGKANCPAVGDCSTVGYSLGNLLPSFNLKDCDGNDVSLEEFCGSKATWLYMAHGWCANCRRVALEAELIHGAFRRRNLASAIVLVEGSDGSPATAAECKKWQAQYALEGVKMYYDPQAMLLRLWEAPYTSLSVVVNGQRQIYGKIHTDESTSIAKVIDAAYSTNP